MVQAARETYGAVCGQSYAPLDGMCGGGLQQLFWEAQIKQCQRKHLQRPSNKEWRSQHGRSTSQLPAVGVLIAKGMPETNIAACATMRRRSTSCPDTFKLS